MKFAPKPENDFAHYIRTYYNECRARFDKIEAIAGKWTFRDLAPGMSDFDTRFIISDDMTDSDWCDMSDAVGEAHLHLCKRFPAWSRNLEHLPGLNLTWSEFTSERLYYPEYKQWSFYHTETPVTLSKSLDKLFARLWDEKDEYFHLKKFCLYYGRYNRTIDPAVNLGIHENKYPMHSRIMHYFLPPLQSAMIILNKENIAGKNDSIDIAAGAFPELRCWDVIREILHADYETPKWYEEPHLSEFEDMLEEALHFLADKLLKVIEIIPVSDEPDVAAWKSKLNTITIDPALTIFDHAKFSRLMKGRLKFYANAPAHFDFIWLIKNELGRMGNNFFLTPFRTFVKLAAGKETDTADEIFDILSNGLLSAGEISDLKAFTDLVLEPVADGKETESALRIAEVFDSFYMVLSKIIRKAHELSE
ncbi:MAG: hypothetical protein ACYTFY_06600 [Planctomycetota bacterium]